jgi:outer membrane protein assembly factor BamA
MKHWCILLFLIFSCINSDAQKDVINFDSTISLNTNKDSLQYTIAVINLSGNKRTKSYIVFREVPFKVGQSYSPTELTKQLELARQQIMNTTLFVDVTVYVANLINNVATVNIDVKERWYLFPLPYFKLVDRNFNQWWFDQNRSLDRVNYGLKFFHNNVSGRNDKVSLDLVNGYNQQIAFGYSQPFADKSLKHGFSFGFGYNRQHEMNYNTINNKQAFLKLDGYARESIRVSASYSYRPDSKYRFSANIAYAKDIVNDTVLKLNPNYFPTLSNSLSFLAASASLQYFAVDYIPFPKKGFMYEVALYDRGFNKTMNLLSLSTEITNAVSFSKNTFLQFHNLGILRFTDNQPFYNQGLLGYGDIYLRGMENYVVDGTAGFLSNTSLYQKLFTYTLKTILKSKGHDKIPFTFYLKVFSDMGYVYNSQPTANTFSNTYLHSAGVGLDVVSIYDFVFRLEYSFNQFGDRGFGFRVRGDF